MSKCFLIFVSNFSYVSILTPLFLRFLKDVNVQGHQQLSVHTIFPFKSASGNIQRYVVFVYEILCSKYAVLQNQYLFS